MKVNPKLLWMMARTWVGFSKVILQQTTKEEEEEERNLLYILRMGKERKTEVMNLTTNSEVCEGEILLFVGF